MPIIPARSRVMADAGNGKTNAMRTYIYEYDGALYRVTVDYAGHIVRFEEIST
jgi:hypothetical protein